MTDKPKERKKRRRARGSGTVYAVGRIYWVSYRGPDGKRHAESSESERKGDAIRLLNRRIGAREHGLPVIPNAEKFTFEDAAQDAITYYETHKPKSLKVARRRIEKHLLPFFTGRRLVGITSADIRAFVSHRQRQGIVRKGQRVADVTPAEINRETRVLGKIFSLAIKDRRIASKPSFDLLPEAPARSGFFDRAQINAVKRHLPDEIADVVEFSFLTAWRLYSEVLPLEWRNVDFEAGEVRLLEGQTKNGKPRTFPMSADLRRLLEARHREHQRLKKAGIICPFVFFRMVADGRGGEERPRVIKSITKAWRNACRLAGCPGRIPHDLRRSAIRVFVRAGISENIAMAMSGHTTSSVFRRYDIVSEGDKKEAARLLDRASAAGKARKRL